MSFILFAALMVNADSSCKECKAYNAKPAISAKVQGKRFQQLGKRLRRGGKSCV